MFEARRPPARALSPRPPARSMTLFPALGSVYLLCGRAPRTTWSMPPAALPRNFQARAISLPRWPRPGAAREKYALPVVPTEGPVCQVYPSCDTDPVFAKPQSIDVHNLFFSLLLRTILVLHVRCPTADASQFTSQARRTLPQAKSRGCCDPAPHEYPLPRATASNPIANAARWPGFF